MYSFLILTIFQQHNKKTIIWILKSKVDEIYIFILNSKQLLKAQSNYWNLKKHFVYSISNMGWLSKITVKTLNGKPNNKSRWNLYSFQILRNFRKQNTTLNWNLTTKRHAFISNIDQLLKSTIKSINVNLKPKIDAFYIFFLNIEQLVKAQ